MSLSGIRLRALDILFIAFMLVITAVLAGVGRSYDCDKRRECAENCFAVEKAQLEADFIAWQKKVKWNKNRRAECRKTCKQSILVMSFKDFKEGKMEECYDTCEILYKPDAEAPVPTPAYLLESAYRYEPQSPTRIRIDSCIKGNNGCNENSYLGSSICGHPPDWDSDYIWEEKPKEQREFQTSEEAEKAADEVLRILEEMDDDLDEGEESL